MLSSEIIDGGGDTISSSSSSSSFLFYIYSYVLQPLVTYLELMLLLKHLRVNSISVKISGLLLNIIVVRHNLPISEGGSLASYIDTQNAFSSVHSAAPQLPLT
jgi:hypothetical protein